MTIAAIAVFLTTYALILAGEKSSRRLDRPSAGLLGGVLMVLCGVLTRQEALAAIDFATLALLLGMMIVIHYATASGLLDAIAHALVDRSRSGKQLLWIVSMAAGILSALFVNDTICLLMTPLVLTITARRRLPPEPYLPAIATSSNVSSLMTLTGNPQNMLIGQSSTWTWGAFPSAWLPSDWCVWRSMEGCFRCSTAKNSYRRRTGRIVRRMSLRFRSTSLWRQRRSSC